MCLYKLVTSGGVKSDTPIHPEPITFFSNILKHYNKLIQRYWYESDKNEVQHALKMNYVTKVAVLV